MRYALREGTYQAIIAVTARDTDATYYAVTITFDGLWWSGPEVRRHVTVHPQQIGQPPLAT
jgi:hypothetical protein